LQGGPRAAVDVPRTDRANQGGQRVEHPARVDDYLNDLGIGTLGIAGEFGTRLVGCAVIAVVESKAQIGDRPCIRCTGDAAVIGKACLVDEGAPRRSKSVGRCIARVGHRAIASIELRCCRKGSSVGCVLQFGIECHQPAIVETDRRQRDQCAESQRIQRRNGAILFRKKPL
jgi:hypothetical protein